MFSRHFGRTTIGGALVFSIALVDARRADAGPPLICHPVEIGTAASLPWGGARGWDASLPSYDRTRLVVDTLRLLGPDTPIPVRRETLRRATIYAARDARASSELLALLVGRALNGEAAGKPDALAWFDAGYLVESYRQASAVYKWDMLTAADRGSWTFKGEPRGLDGHAWVERAVRLSGSAPEMVRAAALIASDPARVAVRE